MTAVMPAQRPGKSEQVVGTPRDFLAAFVARFGTIGHDLAATRENSVIPSSDGTNHFGPGSTLATDSLTADWSTLTRDWNWLNPEFGHIAPWALRCSLYRYERIALLVPLSTSNWAVDDVFPFSRVLGLCPRLTFVGHTSPYPKDMMLALYGTGFAPGFETWRWK